MQEQGESGQDGPSAAIQSYLDSVPYPCESQDTMRAALKDIVDKLFVTAKAKDWLTLTNWDGALQCWLEMRYPLSKPLRAKLVKFYYELTLLPGIEPRITRSWADMLSRLISNKPGLRRKLEAKDLQLEWRPLWRCLKKELWPKKRVAEPTRNLVNILLYAAEQCKRYFLADEIPPMLKEFLPILTKDTALTMIPVLTSFLPPTHTHLYLPVLLRLWEAFNSSIIDDRLLELAGDLAEEHVSGDSVENGTKWKEVGIWNQAEWTFIVGKGLNAMSVPIGTTRFSLATASQADAMSDRNSIRIKKDISRYISLAKLIVYSISVDGPVRSTNGAQSNQEAGFLGGSRALDSLEKLLTSTESFFHPSNTGPWSLGLASFLHRLAAEYGKRLKEEEEDDCRTPKNRRLTPAITKAFVSILKTPALLAMFSKDPACMSLSQGALRVMSILEPDLVMPDLLERAYSGLEIVNETHRTTAVLSMLSGVALPLVSEKVWLGGQKHIVPLLELAIPGIDVNDPTKTMCTTMFVIGIVQHIKIGDLSTSQSGLSMAGEVTGGEVMDVDTDYGQLPDGIEPSDAPVLDRHTERTLARDSTSGFADWVTALFRRVLALYENLPEEGGKKNVTGGKQEENVLKSLKSMIDVVALHLSDQLFDLVLNLVFNYATTNAKSNAVRAFGQLIACLARVNPTLVIDKFLPYCTMQIEEELKHGASSTRTTSSHAAVPSDTTLHWNISILRGCLGYGGSALLKYKPEIIHLLSILVEKTRSERGYSGTGHLISRILHTLAGLYPINSRFVNTDEWEDEGFNKDHNLHWGQMYKPEEVQIEWHVPTAAEIDFVLEILDKVTSPSLAKVQELLSTTGSWQTADRNDFCRFLNVCRSFWSGIPTIFREAPKDVINPCLVEEIDLEQLVVNPLLVDCGLTLTNEKDPRYRKIVMERQLFGKVLVQAAVSLRQNSAGEDHTDAVVSTVRSMDVYLLDYALTRGALDSLKKNYKQARDANRLWSRQKENSRLVMVKRAQLYHSSRVYMQSLYRRRCALDDQIIGELVEASLSPYVRVRRYGQSILSSVGAYYVRAMRFALPTVFSALEKGNDPDRMKGALYVLWNKGTAAYALNDVQYHGRFLLSLLQCQHEEKPSVQKLVSNVSRECVSHMVEEVAHSASYSLPIERVETALDHLGTEFGGFSKNDLQDLARKGSNRRSSMINANFSSTMTEILKVASRQQTHWRYVEMATRFLSALLRRDMAPSPEVAKFFVVHTISPQPTIRSKSQRAVERLTAHAKIRSYSQSNLELWLEEWKSPLSFDLSLEDTSPLFAYVNDDSKPLLFVDKLDTGFLTWTSSTKAYRPPSPDFPSIEWDSSSKPPLDAIRRVIVTDEYFKDLCQLWSQESTKNRTTIELRSENYSYIKSLAKTFESEGLEELLSKIDPLLSDADKYKQRAGAEILTGLLRGSKHWPQQRTSLLWDWTCSRLDRILAHIKPETLFFWESAFSYMIHLRDPRRCQPLINWILALPLEFQGDSAFAMNKMISIAGLLPANYGLRYRPLAEKYLKLLLENANTTYFEIRSQMANTLYYIMRDLWQPQYSSTDAFVEACSNQEDPMRVLSAPFLEHFSRVQSKLPPLRDLRLPPPRVSQSEYDKIGLTLLQFIWASAHGSHATTIFPYVVPFMPEVFRMSELNDSTDLQTFSAAVLQVLSAVSVPSKYIDIILGNFVEAIKSSKSWRIRRHALPALVVFFYRNLMSMSQPSISKVMDVLLECLADENVEVREMASKVLSGIVRCSQRQNIIPLKNRFYSNVRKISLPPRRDPKYGESLRSLHSAILGLCALIESFPYSVEAWMPPLTEVLALHATDPPPISTTIRKCASEFKKTHQDTWHKDQDMFDEDQLQSLSTMLVGTSYYA